ncbi:MULTISPECIES: SDR family oxidoreductase [unclassified Leptolyngbya]|uniref:SDR family NAD(P)-dependent oxidoreductase n=1 Tax=unclassified Leptolyngbya TaxID=2650499 RepID=UPI0016836BCD|nr:MULTISPECIES: SDR family oxidoreductase [unclassified Leptolyngbya]MBD1909134.1 SDR family oxidoreductase [Leptolyngbya sp. FACHB-8]MBD2157508.1 SDR family oxidoreductase [Leptolyngbya sp. FACHB-16]
MTQTVLITGASQGIGKATALKFAQKGYNVVLAARQPDRLEAVAKEIWALGQEALAIPTDVQDWEQVSSLVEKAIAHFGQVDVLINNAGIYYMGPVDQASLEDWQHIIQTNLWGYIHTTHALLPHFLSRQAGTIVNVCSIGGLDAIPYQVPYTTSKFAATGLTKSLQTELKPKGIHVCGIYPSFIRTRLMERGRFRGYSPETAEARHDLVNAAFHSALLEVPEDVATAIWNSVTYQQSDVIVGSAKLWTTAYHLLPGLMKPMIRRIFGMGEHRDRGTYSTEP